MSVQRATAIFCDEEHGAGDVYFPEHSDLGPRFEPHTFTADVRKRAKAHGWRTILGKDYCPNCVDLMKERGEIL